MKKLNIAHNRIEHLPRSLGQLKSLIYINLSNNRFTSIPCSLLNVSHTLAYFSIEWFTYTMPPNPKEAFASDKHGLYLLE